MSALTPATKTELKFGTHRILLYRFTTVTHGDTWASGLNNVCTQPAFFGNSNGSPGGQTTIGVNVIYSAGTVTFQTGSDTLALDLLVIY